jgi:murein DD-endopeptidase MepM/ murein hydrolase activator NlpD
MFKHNPVDVVRVTSPFGPRGIGASNFHIGADFGAKKAGVGGDPLYAVEDGVVRASALNQGGVTKGYGYYTVIEHSGFCTLYAHMQANETKIGQKVKAGDVIGHMGHTGHVIPAGAGGTHLHFEVRVCSWKDFWNAKDKAFDPMKYVVGKDVDNVKKKLMEKTGLSQETVNWMSTYKYADSLFIKLLNAMG